MHADWPLFRSTLDQPIVTNTHIRDHTELEYSIQDFSSAVHQATFTTIPQLTVRCHLLTLPPCPSQPHETQKLLPTALSKIRIPPVSSLHQLLSRVLTSRLTQLRNSKWSSFLGTLHHKQNHFGISPGTSRPLHNLFLPYLTTVCRSSTLRIKPNA